LLFLDTPREQVVDRKLECIKKGIVDTKIINDFENTRVTSAYHGFLENGIAEDLSSIFQSIFVSHSEGDNASYDTMYRDGIALEIKITSQAGDFFLEYAKMVDSSDTDSSMKRMANSGLRLTKAHYYIMLQPGTYIDKEVLKVRILSVDYLKDLMNTVRESTLNKSIGINIRWSDPTIDDGFVGFYAYTSENNLFKLGNFTEFRSGVKNFKYKHKLFKEHLNL